MISAIARLLRSTPAELALEAVGLTGLLATIVAFFCLPAFA